MLTSVEGKINGEWVHKDLTPEEAERVRAILNPPQIELPASYAGWRDGCADALKANLRAQFAKGRSEPVALSGGTSVELLWPLPACVQARKALGSVLVRWHTSMADAEQCSSDCCREVVAAIKALDAVLKTAMAMAAVDNWGEFDGKERL